MKRPLRIPVVLAVVAFGAAATAAATSCEHGRGGPIADANTNCIVFCVPSGSGSGSANCPAPTCATGSNFDMCPPDCIAQPLG